MRKVCIVEDDAAVAASLKAVLESWGFETQVVESGEAFMEKGPDNADCLLLDVRLPGQDGFSVLKYFRHEDPGTPVILMTGHGDVQMAVRALQSGAQDFVEKPFDAADLVERINSVIEQSAATEECRRRLERLTSRETDVLKEVVFGHPNKIIAFNLGISQKTVELHRARVMEKTGANSLSQLVRIALKGGIEVDDLPTA